MEIASIDAGMNILSPYYPSIREVSEKTSHLASLATDIIVFQNIRGFYTGFFGYYILLPIFHLLRIGFPISSLLLLAMIIEGKICPFFRIDPRERLINVTQKDFQYSYSNKTSSYRFADNGLLILSKYPLNVSELESAQIAQWNDTCQIVNADLSGNGDAKCLIENTTNTSIVYLGKYHENCRKFLTEQMHELNITDSTVHSKDITISSVTTMNYYKSCIPKLFQLEMTCTEY